jgi:phasin family protein
MRIMTDKFSKPAPGKGLSKKTPAKAVAPVAASAPKAATPVAPVKVAPPAAAKPIASPEPVAAAPNAPAAAPVAPPKAEAPAPPPAITAPAAVAAAIVETAAIQNEPAAVPAPTIMKGPTMTDTINTATEAAKTFTQDAQSRATAMFSDLNTRAKSAMERSTKLIEELNDFNKGNIEAVVESSKVAAKAAEQLGQQAAETARKNFETATQAMKSFASAKTPTEFFQLQSEFARSAFDSVIAETSKNSEAMLKLAGDVFQPISNRFAVAAEKIKIAA